MAIQLPVLKFRSYQIPLWNYMMQDRPGLRALTVWPRRNGKDLSAINILTAKALQRVGLYQYIAPFANQVRLIIWEGSDGSGKRFIDYVPQELVERKLDQQMKIWLKNGSMIQLCGSDNPDSIVGANPVGQVYTEYSLHKEAVWGYMRPILSENGGWALFNGTPRGLNHMYQLAEMAKSNPDWFYQQLTRDDTGYPSLESIEAERQAGMSESLIQQEYYTDWTASSDDALIPLDKIQIGMQLELPEMAYSFAPRIIGVDPAYAEKGDRAVIARRQGRKVWPFEVYQGIDPMALATRVAAHLRDWRAHFCFVDAGRGEAVWSRLFQLGFEDRVIPVHFDGKTYDDLYHRKKDEIWGRMKNYICHAACPPDLPKDQAMARDLSAPTFTINDRGKMQMENKEHLKSRGVRSTDIGDALALTFAEELDETPIVTPEMERLGITPEMLELFSRPQKEYDPLSHMEQFYDNETTPGFAG
jgi:hypothetical protein